MMRSRISLALVSALVIAGTLPSRADDDPAGAEFFEKEVRPLLVDRCVKCHGEAKHKNDLRLDSRAAALAGGISGPAVVPGKPDESPLIDAINYGDLQMPPKEKLPDKEIAVLTRWVAMGAPWPGGGPDSAAKIKPFDLKERAQHWSFRPVRNPDLPAAKDADWPLSPVDRFLLARLEAEGLTPSPDADRRTWIRRVTFDLIGLPPTPGEIDAFLKDESDKAYGKVVERLLASPHYGERWGRHWLDLVRLAETAGHEFDYDTLNAFRYRDYVVRAFNADLPYDQFVVEHIAGDLIEPPRRHPTGGLNESILGTGFFFLGEGSHSPVDVRDDQVARIDNQIDVLSKTFLGLTVACARCHDHKFDAISTKDYYALAGYLRSSRHQQAFIDPPGRIGARVAELGAIKAALGPILEEENLGIADGLLASRSPVTTESQPAPARWVEASRDPTARTPGHPLFAWAALGTSDSFAARRPALLEDARKGASEKDAEVFEDFDKNSYEGWFVTGAAFGDGPSRGGDYRIRPDGATIPVAPGQAHSGLVSDRLQGVLRSKTFTIGRKYIHYLAAGRGGRINVVVDGFEKIRDPIYGGLTLGVEAGEAPRWHTQDVSMWVGQRAYIELADGATVNYNGARATFFPGDGFLAVDEIRFSDRPTPPGPADDFTLAVLNGAGVDSPEALARRYEAVIRETIADWRAGRPSSGGRFAALVWMLEQGLIPQHRSDEATIARYREIEAKIPAPTLALAIADGTGEDERVMLRGNHRTPGEVAPRRFLETIGGADQPAPASGSGRLELARRLVDPSNPLVARVLVNRVWKHHFGAGIVRTPDDFGAMGEPPTHPELLDWLASDFLERGWSIKQLHRRIVLSRAYRMQSRPDDSDAERIDPDNRLYHRMNIRRLEAEAIRDAMLAVSGRLDRAMSGPSVPPYLTPFMEGRGKPSQSGPLDGDGRRSLYLNVRRNFLNPMFLAFDFPPPASTMGRRNVSNVPAQALTFLNDPFVVEQARLWADRLLKESPDPDDRLTAAHLAAFGRPPTDAERAEARAFLGQVPDDPAAWADLCHVLFNVKEFLFVN